MDVDIVEKVYKFLRFYLCVYLLYLLRFVWINKGSGFFFVFIFKVFKESE